MTISKGVYSNNYANNGGVFSISTYYHLLFKWNNGAYNNENTASVKMTFTDITVTGAYLTTKSSSSTNLGLGSFMTLSVGASGSLTISGGSFDSVN